MLEESFDHTAYYFTKDRRAYDEAKAVIDEVTALDKQLADRLEADVTSSCAALGAAIFPPMRESEFAVPDWLISASHIGPDYYLSSAAGNLGDPTVMELAERTARDLAEERDVAQAIEGADRMALERAVRSHPSDTIGRWI